jgi:hypothetical protein
MAAANMGQPCPADPIWYREDWILTVRCRVRAAASTPPSLGMGCAAPRGQPRSPGPADRADAVHPLREEEPGGRGDAILGLAKVTMSRDVKSPLVCPEIVSTIRV